MKLLFLTMALVALVVSQGFDSDNCDIIGEWANYPTNFQYVDPLWEDEQLAGWGMDGDNKWQDFWSFRTNTAGGRTHYDRVTCNFRENDRSIPSYVAFCGDCSLTGDAPCGCYPYHDVADNFLEYPGPEPGEAPVAPEGWPTAWAAGNPPFEQFPTEDKLGAWTLENCQQYKPKFVYYYTYRLVLHGSGKFEKSYGISLGFTPTQDSWDFFCEEVFNDDDDDDCWVPSSVGGESYGSLFGADYQYQSGEWRESETSMDVQFHHDRFENGCHMKSRDRRYPTAAYCGDAGGWTFGSGTTAHVRFGCDTGTFFDTETDSGRDIDDGDCDSVYVAFDQVNPLKLTEEVYDQEQTTQFRPLATLVRGGNSLNNDCWYESKFIDHRSDLPDYRTKCAAGVLSVPFVGFVGVVVMVLRNLF